ncbi:MAG: glycerate kinase, partial [Desulfurococcales archaeon]|nr:glycerate kinase [Desulfurococcales archaeon]
LLELARVAVEASRLEGRTRGALSGTQLGGPVFLVALGKGAPAMARGALEAIPRVEGGLVATVRGVDTGGLDGLEVVYGEHPVPGPGSLRAGEALLEWARLAGRSRGTLVALVSGGGSAIAEVPVEGVELGDIAEATRLLLASGASIDEVNTVRKHLSRIKGGRLAEAAAPARVLGLYASDVPGDRLDMIASGPTVPDPTTYADALRVLRRYGLYDRMPVRVVEALERGARGELPETPKPGSPVFGNVENRLVASNMDVLEAMRGWLEGRGYRVLVLTSRLEGESREVARVLAAIALESAGRGVPLEPPAAILAGGETTVTVRGPGRGGRNQELALAWAERMSYWGATCEAGLVALDTDGIDGVTDAAGAAVLPLDAARARGEGLDPLEALDRNDSYTLLDRLGALVRTGPTGSNLNSVVAVIVASRLRGTAGVGAWP